MTQNRWDSEGNYYNPPTAPDIEGRDPNPMNLFYREAVTLQERIVQYCSMSDYTIGQAERDDIAQDLINEDIEQGVEAQFAFEALNHWRRMYGRGFQDDNA